MTVLLHSHPWDAPGDPDTVGVHWSMWSTRQWPYLHLNEGDHYFTVTGGSPREGWIQGEARIEHLVLAPYSTHTEAWDLIRTGIPAALRKTQRHGLTQARHFLNQTYTVDAPQSGHLMAFWSVPVRAINRPRPADFKFRPNGWGKLENTNW